MVRLLALLLNPATISPCRVCGVGYCMRDVWTGEGCGFEWFVERNRLVLTVLLVQLCGGTVVEYIGYDILVHWQLDDVRS